MPTPEAVARQQIDQLLADSGWTVQDRLGMNLYTRRGVAALQACEPQQGHAPRAPTGNDT